jgi:nucleoside-diphosphate-sugar epimerase
MITILGTGQVGRAVLEKLQLKHCNAEILLVNKSGKVPFELPKGTRIQSLDATIPEKLIPIFQKSDIVFSCTDVPYSSWGSFYPILSEAMVKGLIHSNTKLVFADNMYSYGNLKGQIIHEDLPHLATTKKGLIRAKIINNFIYDGVNERVAVVKSSDFVGPRIEKGIFGIDFINRIYNKKTVFLPSKTTLPHHFTFIDDFAKALVMVAFEPKAYNQIWHVPNAEALSQKDWVEIFEREVHLKIKYQSIPKFLISLTGLFDPFVKEIRELSYQFEYPYLIDSQKFINQFGDISTSPIEIVQKTIHWYNSTIKTK